MIDNSQDSVDARIPLDSSDVTDTLPPDARRLPRQSLTYDYQHPPTVGDVFAALAATPDDLRLEPHDVRVLWVLRTSDTQLPDPLSMPHVRRFLAALAPDLSDKAVRAFRDHAITLMLGYVSRTSTPTTFGCTPDDTELS